MTDLDIDPVMEARLRHTMRVVADGTPIDTTPWERVVREREPRRAARVVGAAAAAVLVGAASVGIWHVATRPEATQPATVTPSSAPPLIVPSAPVPPKGDGYLIVRGDLAVMPLDMRTGLVLDGSSYLRSTDPAMRFGYRTIELEGDRVIELRCEGQHALGDTGFGCQRSSDVGEGPMVGAFWSEADGQPIVGTWAWSNVPANTDYVQFQIGSTEVWQRPINSQVIFPTLSERPGNGVATAYRADGAVLAVVTTHASEVATQAFLAAHPELARRSLADDRQAAARMGVQQQLLECLPTHSVAVSGTVGNTMLADPGPGQDIEPAWQTCIADAQDWLDEYVAQHT